MIKGILDDETINSNYTYCDYIADQIFTEYNVNTFVSVVTIVMSYGIYRYFTKKR